MRLKMSLRYKIMLSVCCITLIIIIAGVGLRYFWGFRILRDTIGNNHLEMAEQFAFSLSQNINERIKNIEIYLMDHEITEKLRQSNIQYESMNSDDITRFLFDKDKQWVKASDNDTLIKEYLENEVSQGLKKILEKDQSIAEFFITDKNGGIVASSKRTPTFYQANEHWWKQTFNNGNSRVFIGNLKYDTSTDITGIYFAVPIKNSKNEILGIAKVIIDFKHFLPLVEFFKSNEGKHLILFDNNNSVLFQYGANPLIINLNDFKNVTTNKGKWSIIQYPDKTKILVVCVEVINSYLINSGNIWKILIGQKAKNVFLPLKYLLFQGIVLAVILIVLVIPLGLLLEMTVIRPIKNLHKAIQRVNNGEFDTKIKVHANDEIGELTLSFKEMVANIKNKQQEVVLAKEKVEQLAGSLDAQVKERTQELLYNQEATLNIMEDLQMANERLEEKTKELEKKLDELAQAEAKLIQSEKLASLGQLVSSMAHEVSNPMMIIAGRAQIALMEEIQDKYLRESMEIIRDQCGRAKDILQRLLKFSKATKGETTEININDSIESVVKLLEHQYSLLNIKIINNYAPSLPAIKGDDKQLQEVFMNMLNNAAQAMPKGGTITITTLKEKNMVRIEFKDTGEGISEENLKKLFVPFFTTKEKGTGLGLSVCYGIIRAHGGEIKYTSKLGEGTTAIILFPFETTVN